MLYKHANAVILHDFNHCANSSFCRHTMLDSFWKCCRAQSVERENRQIKSTESFASDFPFAVTISLDPSFTRVLILVTITTATSGCGVFFQAILLFTIANAKLWPILLNFGHYVAILCILWCAFYRHRQCDGVPKFTNIRYEC